MAHLTNALMPMEGGEKLLLQSFVTAVASIVVGVVLELFKDWLKRRHNKRH
ncbi:type I toxin-antitoxin system Fst family toxin [Lactococcus petauri]|uniref:type I toxin-antitoxin system Fst family toxin n=1 Tax=Lactococcus petauri TaxID=1940789 RepID=UPI003D6F328A